MRQGRWRKPGRSLASCSFEKNNYCWNCYEPSHTFPSYYTKQNHNYVVKFVLDNCGEFPVGTQGISARESQPLVNSFPLAGWCFSLKLFCLIPFTNVYTRFVSDCLQNVIQNRVKKPSCLLIFFFLLFSLSNPQSSLNPWKMEDSDDISKCLRGLRQKVGGRLSSFDSLAIIPASVPRYLIRKIVWSFSAKIGRFTDGFQEKWCGS